MANFGKHSSMQRRAKKLKKYMTFVTHLSKFTKCQSEQDLENAKWNLMDGA